MSSPTCGLRVASAFIGLICLVHILRIVAHVSVVVGGHPISRKISAVAVVITGALCIWLWLVSSQPAAAAPEAGSAPPPA